MTHDEMIAVITAHKEGKQIEGREQGATTEFKECKTPAWDFKWYEYRIKPTPIPPGDLTWDEAKRLHEEGVNVQWFNRGHERWWPCNGLNYLGKEYAYRRTPVHHKVKLGPEDVPPGSVVRHPEWPAGEWKYCQPQDDGVEIMCWGGVGYRELQSDGWLIQRPGQEWQRCEKDEVAN